MDNWFTRYQEQLQMKHVRKAKFSRPDLVWDKHDIGLIKLEPLELEEKVDFSHLPSFARIFEPVTM